MKVVFIYVEGPTEELFVKTILQPHLRTFGVHSKPFNCGGTIKYQSRLRKFILQKANEAGIDLVTMMFDFYKLPKDFPGRRDLPSGTCYERVAHIEQAISKDIGHSKFSPYIMLHEFEALLFAAPNEIANAFPDKDESHALQQIKAEHGDNPEEINDNESTAPSKRIEAIYPSYEKVLQGAAIIQKIGLDVVRQECRHFNDWLTKLESLGRTSS